jgi:hypothetical protein
MARSLLPKPRNGAYLTRNWKFESISLQRGGFEGKRNPRDLFTGPDRLIPPAMQQAKLSSAPTSPMPFR